MTIKSHARQKIVRILNRQSLNPMMGVVLCVFCFFPAVSAFIPISSAEYSSINDFLPKTSSAYLATPPNSSESPTVNPSATSIATYVVRPLDNLSQIAQRFNIRLDELLRVNEIANPNLIYSGQVIIIPLSTAPITPTDKLITPTPSPSDAGSYTAEPAALPTETPSSTDTPTIEPTVPTETPSPADTSTIEPTALPTETRSPADNPTIEPTALPTETQESECVSTPLSIPQDALFVDEFENNEKGWYLPDGFEIVAGELRVNPDQPMDMVIVPVGPVEQVYIEVDVRLQTSENRISGIVALGAFSESSSYSYVAFDSERIEIFEVVGGREQLLTTTQSEEAFFCYERVGVLYRNNQIEVYVNGLISAIASTFEKPQQVGLGQRSWSDAGEAFVYYDNIVIRLSRN